jgi:hypothetical protein
MTMPSMHPLGELIESRMRVNDWSLDAVVARADNTLGRSNLGRIINDPVISIKGEVIKAIAAGIGVTPQLVANAALRSMGIEPAVEDQTDTLATVDIDPTLSDANRRQLRLLVEQMRLDSPKRPPLGRIGRKGARKNRANDAD